MSLPVINQGKRALAAGRTGSGKSTWACWMLTHSPGKWVILNPKHTKAYNGLFDSTTINTLDMKTLEKALNRYRFVIINVPSQHANKEIMDAFVMTLHQSWQNVGLCCDELYTLHNNGVAGQGLLGWLTRGRELKQSFLGLTQRSAWLSQFLFSESDYICGMALNLEDDRKRMEKMTGHPEFMAKVPNHFWLWHDVAKSSINYFGPVPIDE